MMGLSALRWWPQLLTGGGWGRGAPFKNQHWSGTLAWLGLDIEFSAWQGKEGSSCWVSTPSTSPGAVESATESASVSRKLNPRLRGGCEQPTWGHLGARPQRPLLATDQISVFPGGVLRSKTPASDRQWTGFKPPSCQLCSERWGAWRTNRWVLVPGSRTFPSFLSWLLLLVT